jgi:hypothetical protein
MKATKEQRRQWRQLQQQAGKKQWIKFAGKRGIVK